MVKFSQGVARGWAIGWFIVALLHLSGSAIEAQFQCFYQSCPFGTNPENCVNKTNCEWSTDNCTYFLSEDCGPYYGGVCARCACIRVCDEGQCFVYLTEGCVLFV